MKRFEIGHYKRINAASNLVIVVILKGACAPCSAGKKTVSMFDKDVSGDPDGVFANGWHGDPVMVLGGIKPHLYAAQEIINPSFLDTAFDQFFFGAVHPVLRENTVDFCLACYGIVRIYKPSHQVFHYKTG
ncbi:MAG: hypothetical protein BWX99_03005 [Deltaproteobacteria bacterium ADurb.Bin151]|nr:MAG: hypothetical protein BWX99_03005 [Deltaproteobacteria bacterium ADurb.Bin151]